MAASLRLAGPPPGVRPTTDRVREVLFSSLGALVEGRPFVDLYAGSGAVGIEALSRGASRCLFVERSKGCVEAIRANLARAGFGSEATVIQRDVARALDEVVAWLAGEPGVVFADPPYEDARALRTWAGLLADGRLAAGTVAVLEMSGRMSAEGLPAPAWERKVGETRLMRWQVTEETDTHV